MGAEDVGQMYEYRPSAQTYSVRSKGEVDTSITDAAAPLNHELHTICARNIN
jgi:hypothetical protein